MFGKIKAQKEFTLGSPEAMISTPGEVQQATRNIVADMRTLSVALEAYAVDMNQYPPSLAPNLTTPVAYITKIPSDPFNRHGEPYQYALKDGDWVVWSIGPDKKDDEGEIEYSSTNGATSPGDIIGRKGQDWSRMTERISSSRSRFAPPKPVDVSDEAAVRAGYSRAKADMRSLATALESYYIDMNQYPPSLAPNLTTPITYITHIPYDSFSPQSGTLNYWVAKNDWKLWSIGPDQNNNLAEIVYDPTNGTTSAGDLIRVKQ